eukprot:2415725-Lingulodinium_polyedra.AAC.1
MWQNVGLEDAGLCPTLPRLPFRQHVASCQAHVSGGPALMILAHIVQRVEDIVNVAAVDDGHNGRDPCSPMAGPA